MASKYVQTTLNITVFKRLKLEAIDREIPMYELLRQILEDWEKNLTKEGEQHG